MDNRDLVRSFAPGYPGTSNGYLCPWCEGGRHREQSFSVTRQPDGVILFICYRASCGARGRLNPDGWMPEVQSKPAPQGRRYTEATEPLGLDWCSIMLRSYGINGVMAGWYQEVATERLVCTIRDSDGWPLGVETRAIRMLPGVKKTLHYRENMNIPWMSWYRSPNLAYIPESSNPVLLVEDVLSAYKAATVVPIPCVSLMGSNLSTDDIIYIRERYTGEVILALDRDASAKALDFKRRFNLLCPNFRVVLLSMDLKYETPERIRELILT